MPVQRTSYQLVDNQCSASNLKTGLQTAVLNKKAETFPSFLHFCHASAMDANGKIPGQAVGLVNIVWEYFH